MVRVFTLLAVLVPAVALCQIPDLAGTWRLDDARSRVEAEATLAGLIGTGAPATLHVTQPANGTLVVESQINESHSRLYVPGAETKAPIFLGEAGTITMTSRWDGRRLVSEGSRQASSGESGAPTQVREIYGLSDDGATLEVDITTSGDGGTMTSSLRYTRITDVGPCESWPTPCKEPAQPNP